jgi:hypothetical protein
MYNYQDWITMVNNALASSHVDLCNQVRISYPSDAFAGQAPYYTEVLTVKTATGQPYLGAFSVFVSDLSNLNYTYGVYNITNSDGSTTTLTIGRVGSDIGVDIGIRNTGGQYLSTATNLTQKPIFKNIAGGSLTDTARNNNVMTYTETFTTPAVAASLPPFMQIDLTTLTCVLNADAAWYSGGLSAVGIARIYFNTRLYELFAGFPNYFIGYSSDSYTFPGTTTAQAVGDRNYQILTTNNNYSNTLSVNNNGTTQKYIQAFQEVSSVGLWNPVASIVFTSTTLPIHPTLTSPPQVYNSSSNGMQGGGSTNLTNILSDFEIAISNTNQYRPEIAYAPPGEYRLIDMYSNSNLNKIDLNVYWKDRYGNLKPLRLQPGCSASVKLLFRHKGFYLGAD